VSTRVDGGNLVISSDTPYLVMPRFEFHVYNYLFETNTGAISGQAPELDLSLAHYMPRRFLLWFLMV
jgi:hypothetical protein